MSFRPRVQPLLLLLLCLPGYSAAQTTGCSFGLSPAKQTLPPTATTVTVALTASRTDCAWSAASDSAWAVVSAPTSGAGNATLRIGITANDGTDSRSATIRAGGVAAIIEQRARTPWRPVPEALFFQFQPGGGNPTDQKLGLWTSRGSLDCTVTTSGGSWFSVKNTGSFKVPGVLTVSVRPSGLSTGVYRGQITIKTTTGNPLEHSVPVTLVVSSPLYTREAAVGVPDPTGPAPGTSWPLASIGSVAADTSGNLYSADPLHYRILKLAPDGTMSVLTSYFPREGKGLYYIAVGADGGVYYAESRGRRIYKVSGAQFISDTVVAGGGSQTGENIPATSAEIQQIWGLISDGKGSLYFVDFDKVRRISPDGQVQTVAGGGSTYLPKVGAPATSASFSALSISIGMDSAGDLHISDEKTLYRVSPTGTITRAQTASMGKIAVAADGTVYGTSDRMSIRKVPPDGQVVNYAGSSEGGYSGDGGAALDARFLLISELAIDSAGNLIVADAGNGLLRRIAIDGQVGKLAGIPITRTGPGTSVIFRSISDLAMDRTGAVWFLSYGSLYRLDLDGIVREVSDAGISSKSCTSLAVNPSGELFLYSVAGVIYKYTSSGLVAIAGGGATALADGIPASSAQFPCVKKIAAGLNGEVYVADCYRNRLWRIPGDGSVRLVQGPMSPYNLAVDSSGQVYVGTFLGDIWKVSPVGAAQRLYYSVGGTLGSVAVGPLDQLFYYTSNGFNILETNGKLTKVDYNNFVDSNVSLEEPYRMAVDGSGRVYLMSVYQDRIQALKPVYGTCTATPSADRVEIPAAGGTASIEIRAGDRCGWLLEGAASWISLTSSASGTGNGSVALRVAANTGPAQRVFTYTLAGLSFTVTQQGQLAVPFAAPEFVVIGGGIQSLAAPDGVVFISAVGGLAVSESIADSPSVATQLTGTTVEINGQPAILHSAFPDRIVCVVPRGTQAGTASVVVKVFGVQIAAGSITIAPVAPGILLVGEDELGEVDGYNAVTQTPAPFDVETPANAGEDKRTRVRFRATGIRYADGRQPDGQVVDVSRFLRIEAVEVDGKSLSVPVEKTEFSSVYPGVDLITVILPPEANRTPKVIIRVFVGNSGSNPAAIPIRQTKLQVSSVNVAGGVLDVAQNAWIEIKGTALAPASVGTSGYLWSSAPEFASGRMPTALQGVSVKVNGRSAYVYWVSPTQVNVLTPLDNTLGPVEIQVTNGSTTSAPFTVNLKTVAPAFLRFGASNYVVAQHGNSSLLGPASMSVPGYTFTPAQPGETVTIYGTGFGLPSTALVDGSATQFGTLAQLPKVQIGGIDAKVEFAGVVSPGLYQLNVTVPASIQSGDRSITCTYEGSSVPAGALIPVQR